MIVNKRHEEVIREYFNNTLPDGKIKISSKPPVSLTKQKYIDVRIAFIDNESSANRKEIMTNTIKNLKNGRI